MRDAERVHGGDQLAAVADVDRARGAERVERESRTPRASGSIQVTAAKEIVAQERQRVAVGSTEGQQAVADPGVATRRRGSPDSAKFRETKG